MTVSPFAKGIFEILRLSELLLSHPHVFVREAPPLEGELIQFVGLVAATSRTTQVPLPKEGPDGSAPPGPRLVTVKFGTPMDEGLWQVYVVNFRNLWDHTPVPTDPPPHSLGWLKMRIFMFFLS